MESEEPITGLSSDRKLHLSVGRPYRPFMVDMFMRGYGNHEYFKNLYFRPGTVRMAYINGVFYNGDDLSRFINACLKSLESQDKTPLDVFNNVYFFGSKILKHVQDVKGRVYQSDKDLFADLEVLFNEMEQIMVACPGYAFQVPITEKIRALLPQGYNHDECVGILSFPEKENIALIEQKKFYRLGSIIQKDKVATVSDLSAENLRLIEDHISEFGWINARGGNLQSWTPEEVFERISQEKDSFANKLVHLEAARKESLEQSHALIQKLNLSNEDERLIAVAKELVYFRTYRTDTINEAAFYMQSLLKQAAEILNISHEEITCMTVNEILSRQVPTKETLELRSRDIFAMTDAANTHLLVEDRIEMEKFRNKYIEKSEATGDTLFGNSAYRGRVTGTVRIITSKEDIQLVQKGDVIVAAMTTPNMVPAMEKAAAFVTDEGGITCHAAIIAREMKKPCVIATKFATKVFKDGDMIEVDADNGVVRKIDN